MKSLKLIWGRRPGYIWTAVGGVTGGALFFSCLAFGYITRMASTSGIIITPVLTIVRAPSMTPIPPTQTTITQTPVPTTPPTLPPSPEGFFTIGQLVIIHGTGSDGLRLRNRPGLEAAISFVALENEVFQIDGGPSEQDGYVWWYLVNPYDSTKTGWAVMNFLRLMDSP